MARIQHVRGGFRDDPFAPLVPGFRHVPLDDVAALEAAVTDRTAGVIVEVVQGEGGVRPAAPAFLAAARRACDAHGALLIVDEIQTGLARTGRWFAVDHWGVVPDIVTMAKGLTSSVVPLGAVAMRPWIAEPFERTTFQSGLTYNSHPLALAAALAAVAVSVAVAGCQSSSSAAGEPDSSPGAGKALPPVRVLAARQAPAGWHTASLLGGKATLAFPPAMHTVRGDRGSASAAQLAASGSYLMYINATPKQGTESLRDWPDFRLEHLKEDDASAARLIAESHGVRFLGGTGTCVIDAYVTKVKSNHYTELACFVRGQTTSSVIIAAAPTTNWASAAPVLMRAVAAYRVQ